MKYLLRLLCGLLLLPALLLLMVSTEQGTRVFLGSLTRLVPLTVEHDSGSLSGSLQLSRLSYETGAVRVELEDVVAELAPGCLWRGALCFRQLQVQQLDIALSESSTEGQSTGVSAPVPVNLIVFPVTLETDSLALAGLRVRWPGGQWRAGSAQARVRIRNSSIDLPDVVMQETVLVLQEDDDGSVPVEASLVLPAIDLPFALSVGGLRLLNSTWDFYGAEYELDNLSLRGRWLRSELQLQKLNVEDRKFGELLLDGNLGFSANWPLQVNADLTLAQPLPWTEMLGRKLHVSAGGNLESLSLRFSLPGAAELVGEGLVNMLEPGLPFTANVKATSEVVLPLGDIEGMPEDLDDGKLEFPLSASVNGSLDMQDFTLQAGVSGFGYESLRITLTGHHEPGRIVIAEALARDESGANEVRGSGDIQLSEKVTWSVALQSSGLQLPQLSEQVRGRLAGDLKLRGEVLGDEWQVAVVDADLGGAVNELPASIRGFAGIDSALRLSRSELEAEVNGAQLSLQASGKADAPGYLQLKVAELGRWLPDSRGQLQLQAQVSTDRERVELSAIMHSIAWNGLSIAEGTVSGDYQAAANNAFSLEIGLSHFGFNDLELNALKLMTRGDASRQSAVIASEGDVQGELSLTGAKVDKKWQGVLAPARLQTYMGDWELPEAIAIAWSADTTQLSMDAHCWEHQYARLCPGAWLLGERGGGELEMTGDMKLFGGVLPPGMSLEGDIQLQLETAWTPETEMTVNGQSQVGALTLRQEFDEGESATVDWSSANASFLYRAGALQLELDLQQAGRRVLGLELQLPQASADDLAGSVNLEDFELAAFAPLLPGFSTVAGELTGALSLAGTRARPLGYGELSLSGGRLALAGNPTELEKLNLAVDVRGDRAEVHGAGLLGGGELQLAGQFTTIPDYRLELTVEGGKHNLLYPPSTELLVSENLRLVVARDLLDITGEVTVHSGVLEFEQLPPDSVAVSPFVVEVDHNGNVLQEELPFDIAMDVRVHLLNQLKVTGSNMDATLGGELHLQQQRGRGLRVFGQLTSQGGELRAYQRRLIIKRGVVSFSGPPGNPIIDVRAEREIVGGDVTVGIQVMGPLEEDLVLEIYSNPVMSQADAFSYLLRGRPVDTGAGADGTAMALSLASGVVNRTALVTELNRIPGISNVGFGAQGSEDDTAATVSGYIGERIYLSYGFGLYEPVNVLTARLYLRARLWFEVVSSLENSADLYYSFDID